jgi:CHAD domain-containing protein
MYADRLYRRLIRTASKQSPDIAPKQVHLLRTTSRRLQMALAANAEGGDKLHRQLRKIRRQAGRVRDLDVQLAALRTIDLPSAAAEQKKVKRALERMREQRARKLHEFLLDYTPNLRQPERQRPEAEPHRAPEQNPLRAALDSFAAAAAKFRSGADADLHGFRIAVKKARYTAELAQNEPEAANAIADFKAIQNAIGDWHDWSILTETAADVLGNRPHSRLLNVLRRKLQARLTRARRVIAENTKRLLALRNALVEHAAAAPKMRPASVKLRQRNVRAL